MKNLDGKVIVIAGCSGGIGSAVYKKLLFLKAKVIGISRTENIHLKNFAEQNNLEYNWIKTDLTTAAGWQDSLNNIKDNCGRIDILINCVGMLVPVRLKVFQMIKSKE